MTAKPLRIRRQRPLASGPRIHIPHSSWTQAERPAGAAALVKPEDFWSRLGI